MNFSHLAINVCLIGSVSSRSVSPNVTARTTTRIRMATKVRIRQRLLRLFPGALYSPDSIQPRGEKQQKMSVEVWLWICSLLSHRHTHTRRSRSHVYLSSVNPTWRQRAPPRLQSDSPGALMRCAGSWPSRLRFQGILSVTGGAAQTGVRGQRWTVLW